MGWRTGATGLAGNGRGSAMGANASRATMATARGGWQQKTPAVAGVNGWSWGPGQIAEGDQAQPFWDMSST